MISPELPPPPQPNHVVATIENLPPEGSDAAGGRSAISAPSPSSVRQRIRKVFNRELLLSIALGQVLSLLICGIGLTSKYLSEDFHANTPVFQSFLNYILLFLVYTTTLAVRQGLPDPYLLPMVGGTLCSWMFWNAHFARTLQ